MSTRTIGFSVYLNGQLVDEQTFDRPVISIGKLSTATLRVEDVNVSRKHAVIERVEDGRWRVTDLGSTNGTVIKDERITQAYISDGDRIVLGTTTIVVHLGKEAVKAPAPAASPGETPSAAPATPGAPAKAASPAARRPAGEVRGLGDASFLKKRLADEPDGEVVLDVALLWGETILSARTWDKPRPVVIGTDASADFVLSEEVLGSPTHTLIEVVDGQFALTLKNPNLTGDVLRDGKVHGLDELAAERNGRPLTLDKPTRARIKLGEFSLLVSYGPGIRLVLPPRVADREPTLYMLLSAVVHIAFLVVAMTIPKDMLLQTRDPRVEREKFFQMARVEPKPEEKEEKPEDPDEEDPTKKKFDPNATEEQMKVRQTETVTPDLQPQRRPELVNKLQREQRQQQEDLSKLSADERKEKAREIAQQTALADTMRNSALMDQLMNTEADPNQKQIAFRTLGSYDPSSAGGSFSDGAIDPFSGTLGSGGSGGFISDGGPGGGPGGPGGPAVAGVFDRGGNRRNLNDLAFNERPAVPRIVESAPRLSGELDAKTVQMYIRRFLPGIKWCYQDRLQRNRQLAGKLTLQFTILPSGGVHNAQTANSTMGDDVLHECIRNKMARWRFPSPKDGGVVEVAYPLILKSQ